MPWPVARHLWRILQQIIDPEKKHRKIHESILTDRSMSPNRQYALNHIVLEFNPSIQILWLLSSWPKIMHESIHWHSAQALESRRYNDPPFWETSTKFSFTCCNKRKVGQILSKRKDSIVSKLYSQTSLWKLFP